MRIWFNHWFSTAYHLINMIKADTNNEFHIIGTSTNSSAIYKMTCDEWYSEEKDISASDYIDFCVEFCKEHNVEIFVPRRFLEEIIANKNRFDAIGVRLFANTNAELVQMLDDKQSTYAYFKSTLPEIVPETRVAHSLDEFCLHYDELSQIATRVCYKLIEDEGARSFRVIDNSIESLNGLLTKPGMKVTLEAAKKVFSEYHFEIPVLLMPYLSGVEISVDCVATANGNLIIPRYKTSKRYSEIILSERIISMCDEIMNKLNANGDMNMPMNIQFKMENDKPYLLEINPRMSGGLQLSCKAIGINLPHIAMNELLGKEIKWEYPRDYKPQKVAHIETPININ